MNCPRCKRSLTEGKFENEQALFCHSCSGILVIQRSLTTILNKLSYALIESIGENTVIPPLPDKGAVTGCPECSGKMHNYGYMGSSKVMIDLCTVCNWLWIDALELSIMAKLCVQTDKRVERRRTSYTPTDIVGAHMIN